MLHWIINPGLVINELLLGQRVPKLMLIDKQAKGNWFEKSRVPCPHCNTVHSGMVWTPKNNTAMRNWFGLYCPSCGGIIPCLMNVTTFIVLVITSPIWYWFRKSLKNKWLAAQPSRYVDIDTNPATELNKKTWWKLGLRWGGFMFIFMTIFEYFDAETLSLPKIGFNLLWWMGSGLVFGLIMKAMFKSKLESK